MNTLTWSLYRYTDNERASVSTLCTNFFECKSKKELSTMFKDMAKVFHPDSHAKEANSDGYYTELMQYISNQHGIAKTHLERQNIS